MKRTLFALALLIAACSNPPTDKGVPVVIVGDEDMGPVAVIECGPSRIECGGDCIDPSIDSEHCATCNVGCADGTVCSNGECLAVPADCRAGGDCPPRYFCDESTGFCSVGCESNTDCAAGSFCELESHACLCPTEGEVVCGSACVAEGPLSCGVSCESCNGPARSTAVCAGGACGFECDAGTLLCDGVCSACPTDSAVLATACLDQQCVASQCAPGHEICDGACAPCPDAEPGSSLGCDGGACVVTDCPSGTKLCDGECASCPSDPNGSTQCQAEQCVLTCSPGFHLCNGGCVSDDDATACGTSCTVCATDPNGTASCEANTCTLQCAQDFRDCQSQCAACPTGPGVAATRCAGAACVVDVCAAGFQPCSSGCCQPPPIGPVEVTGEFGSVNSLALDSQGFPHVAHAGGGMTRYSRWDGSAWQHEAVADGDFVAIALDANDVPHVIIHHDIFNAGTLRYATKVGNSWNFTPIAAVGAGATPDILIDNAGMPHVSFHGVDANNVPDNLAHATASNGWSVTTIDTNEVGYGSSLAAVGNVLHLMYHDGSVDAVYTRRLDLTAGGWSNTSNVNGSTAASFITPTSIALGLNGQGYGVFETIFGAGVARWTGTLWGNREIVSNEDAEDPDVALDSNGTPHVVFTGLAGLRHAELSGATWTLSTLDNGLNTGQDPDLEFDAGGTGHIVYFSVEDNTLMYTRF